MEAEEVTSYKDLLDFIAEKNRLSTIRDITTKEIGIAEKSFYRIKQGIEPGEKIKRNLRGYMETNYDLVVKELGDGKIQLVRKQIINIDVGHKEDVASFLLEELRDAKLEMKKLREENDLLKKELKLRHHGRN